MDLIKKCEGETVREESRRWRLVEEYFTGKRKNLDVVLYFFPPPAPEKRRK